MSHATFYFSPPFTVRYFWKLPSRFSLFIQRTFFAQKPSELPLSDCNWTIYLDSGNISFFFKSESDFILKMCCHLSTSSSASGNATLTSSKKGLSYICCFYVKFFKNYILSIVFLGFIFWKLGNDLLRWLHWSICGSNIHLESGLHHKK